MIAALTDAELKGRKTFVRLDQSPDALMVSESGKAAFIDMGRGFWAPLSLLRRRPHAIPSYGDELFIAEWFLLKNGVQY